MNKLNFDYNLKKDAWSWVLIAKDTNNWGLNWREQIAQIPDDLLSRIEKTNFAGAQKVVENHIENDFKKEYKRKVINAEIQALKKTWFLVEKKYFGRP